MLAVPGGALSHWSAAAAWDLPRLPSGRLHVTTTTNSRSTRTLTVHHRQARTARIGGLATTTVGETLKDLASTTTQHRLERLLQRAEQLRLLDTTALAGPGGRRGAERLRRALDAVAPRGVEVTRSDLEEVLLAAVAHAGLPRPEVNQWIEGFEVDLAWRDRRLVAEADGAGTHFTRGAFERDRRRDQLLAIAGWQVLRFTYTQITDGTAVDVLRKLL